MKPSSIILFEPICRGSRLQILANTIIAIRKHSDRPIKVVTRSDYDTAHLRELMIGTTSSVDFVTADTDLDGMWIKILTAKEMKAMLVALDRAAANSDCSDIVFMALDDYLVPLLPHLGRIRRRFAASRVIVMKYRVDYLLTNRRMNWRAFWLSAITRWVLLRMRARLVCFDERFFSTTLAGKPVSVIPDPWFGEFSPLRRNEARAKYGYHGEEFVVLTLGRQDRRKGFPLVLEVIPKILKHENNRFFLVGRADSEFSNIFDCLKKRFTGKIFHIGRFIDEAELPDVFASADVFLLPYARDFTATSGTLSRAAASGVPVVSGEHGLVGHRIKKFGLGEVFDIEDPSSLLQGIETIQSYGVTQRLKVAQALTEFAASTHINVFEESIGNLFDPPTYQVSS